LASAFLGLPEEKLHASNDLRPEQPRSIASPRPRISHGRYSPGLREATDPHLAARNQPSDIVGVEQARAGGVLPKRADLLSLRQASRRLRVRDPSADMLLEVTKRLASDQVPFQAGLQRESCSLAATAVTIAICARACGVETSRRAASTTNHCERDV